MMLEGGTASQGGIWIKILQAEMDYNFVYQTEWEIP